MQQQYVKKILESSVYDVALKTPIDPMHSLSKRLNHQVLLKREDLQPVHSFKIRGAYNRISQLTDAEKQRGVICASAGNHAQGVALAAKTLGIKSVIVMPDTTPEIKQTACDAYGATVILHGDTFDQALSHAMELRNSHNYTFIHPYDDPDIIAGQGTIGMELLQQHPATIDVLFVPVGGGGLAAGIATYVKYVRPRTRIVGVEYEQSACLKAALEADSRVTLPSVGLFADGTAVAQVGQHTFELCRQYVDEVITVTSDEICAAIKDIFDDTRSVCEPSGALALAGLKKQCELSETTGKTVVAIASGANINFDRLRYVAERAETGEKREAILAVTIPEKTGSFRTFCAAIGRRNITEFNYRYHHPDRAQVFVGVQSHEDRLPVSDLIDRLTTQGYEVTNLTDNEMAKLHIRHTVGGCNESVRDERAFRFEFPERPGALLHFLDQIGDRWNITLFHYRNHGAAYGRAAVGFNVPEQENTAFQTFIDRLNSPCKEETANVAFKKFMTPF